MWLEIVENPKSILKGARTPKRTTISSDIYRAKFAPEDLTAQSHFHFDLDLPNRLPRTRSFSVLDQPDLELPSSPPQSVSTLGLDRPLHLHHLIFTSFKTWGSVTLDLLISLLLVIISLSSIYQLPKLTLYLIKKSSWWPGMHLWFYLNL